MLEDDITKTVKSMTKEQIHALGRSFELKDNKHYYEMQVPWLEEQKYLLGTRLGHDPTQEEWCMEVLTSHVQPEFRAYYGLAYQDKVTWIKQ
jgi:hypothetical protein